MEDIDELALKGSAGYRNLVAVKDYSVETRKLFRILQEENKTYINQILQLAKALETMRNQLTEMTIRMQGTGPTG